MSGLRNLNRAVQNATFPSAKFAQAVRDWIDAATERMEPESEPAKVECPNCEQPVGPGWDHEVHDEQFICEPAKVECPNCHQETDTTFQHEVRLPAGYPPEYTCKPAQPEPATPYYAAPMMGFPCANCGQETLRMDGHVSHRASGDETEYYCDKPAQPEPVAAEIPEAVRNCISSLVQAAADSDEPDDQFEYQRVAENLESFWRTQATLPAKVRMTEELERVLLFAWKCADGNGTIRSDIAYVRAQAAEAGIKLPKVRSALMWMAASYGGQSEGFKMANHGLDELDAAEGRK